jgi:hypothetical protein
LSSAGDPGEAFATSAARTAYPSIPLDANSGRSTVDLMSVAATQP